MAVTLSMFAPAGAQFFSNSGQPLAGGLIYTYAAGTSTPVYVFTDNTGLIQHTNPIVLDANGRVPHEIWLTYGSNYKFVLKDSDLVTIGSYDNINGVPDAATLTTAVTASVLATLSASNGSSLIGFNQAGSAVNTTAQAKMREIVSVKDFGATGDGVTDDTSAIQAAVTAAANKTLHFPAGTYLVSAIISVPSNSSFLGDQNVSIIKIKTGSYASANTSIFNLNTVSNIYIAGLTFNGNKGNIGTAHNPINTMYQCSNVTWDNCIWTQCEGICLNISTSTKSITVKDCQFLTVGGKTDNSDGYRNQAIAFSTGSGTICYDTEIRGCYFFEVGLDCISLANCTDVVIADNIAEDSYTFVFNNPAPLQTTNLSIVGNTIKNTNQGSLNNSVNPVAIDLPSVSNCAVIGNAIYKCEQAGIGIFDGSDQVIVANNVLVDVVTKGVSWCGGISVGANGAPSGSYWITIVNNQITSNATTMQYGILVQSDIDSLFISGNTIPAAAVSRLGVYTAGLTPSPANATALTSNSQVSASTCIQDINFTTAVWTNWRATNTLTGYYVNGTKVVGAQQAAIPNSGDATVNSILAALRTHGLIAT